MDRQMICFFTGEGFLRICCQRLPDFDRVGTDQAKDAKPRGENSGGGRVWQDFGSMEDM